MRRTLAAVLLALPALAAAKLPHFASIGGLQIDRRAWTVTGEGVDVAIDHEGGRITGKSREGCVDLKFSYSPEKSAYTGTPECGNLRYSVDWVKGLAEGQYNGKSLSISFSGDSQTMTGSYGGRPFEAKLKTRPEEPGSGVLKGRMNGDDVSLPVVNAGILEFVEHLYLFLKP